MLLIAGSYGMAGAAVLSARAASRAGAGLVTAASCGDVIGVLQQNVPEATCFEAVSYTHLVEPNPEGTQDPNAQEGTQDPDNPEGTPGADSSTEASSSAETSQTESSDPGAGSTESPTIEIPQTNRYAQYNSLVESIEVVDSATVKLTMTKPGVEALYLSLIHI